MNLQFVRERLQCVRARYRFAIRRALSAVCHRLASGEDNAIIVIIASVVATSCGGTTLNGRRRFKSLRLDETVKPFMVNRGSCYNSRLFVD